MNSQNIFNYRKVVENALSENKLKKRELNQIQKGLEELESDLSDHQKVREVYQQAALATQKYIENHISSIVTNALQSVYFEKNLEFKLEFDKKRNSTECNLTLLDDGDEYEFIDDKGFGVADVASFALRVAYILMDDVDKVLVMDEPFRNLDNERMLYASKMVAELSKELNMQFIVSTHIDELTEAADKVVRLKLISKDTTKVI